MKILAIDTSSSVCSVAILEDDKLIDKNEIDDGKTHSENLMPLLDEVLKRNSIDIKDINMIACTVGPGSFTGIRIGVTAANTMADMLNVEVKSFSVLDLIAANVLIENEIVCSMLDARNDRYYVAIYTKTNDKIELSVERKFFVLKPCKNKVFNVSRLTVKFMIWKNCPN